MNRTTVAAAAAVAGAAVVGGALYVVPRELWTTMATPISSSSSEASAAGDESSSVRGKLVAITGANSGLGLAAARRLATMGARLVLFLRPGRKGDLSDEGVADLLGGALAAIIHCDLSDFGSVRGAVAELSSRGFQLDAVVLNAGCVTMRTELTAQGLEMMRGVMFFGHWVLVNELLARGLIGDTARIVAVASEGHRVAPPLQPRAVRVVQTHTLGTALQAYGDAKLLVVAFMSELQRRMDAAGKRVLCLCLCPGAMNSNIVPRNVPRALHFAAKSMLTVGFKSPESASVHLVQLLTIPPPAKPLGRCVYFYLSVERPPREDATDPALGKELWQETEQVVQRLDKGERLPLAASL